MSLPAQSDPRILARRTLQRDHRLLAEFLKPGFSVLDVGCGTGAIAGGDRESRGSSRTSYRRGPDAGLARTKHGKIPKLKFEKADVTSLPFRAQFDIVTAARTLPWVSEPSLAVLQMKQAAKSSGMLVGLNYNHGQQLPDT